MPYSMSFFVPLFRIWVLFLLSCLIIIECKQDCSSDVCNKAFPLCKYQSSQQIQNCFDRKNILNNDEDQMALLHKINSRRNKVAAGEIRSLPSAENMLKLVWNKDLAKMAQRWADQCVEFIEPVMTDPCLDTGDASVGQNVATVYGESPGLTPTALVDVWYTELLNLFNASIVTQFQSSSGVNSSRHERFTQLAWAETSEVGCGGTQFKGSGAHTNRTVYRLVCNFSPAGNRIGRAVYSGGVPCSGCPDGGSCDRQYTALCPPGIQTKFTENIKNSEYKHGLTSPQIANEKTSLEILEKENNGQKDSFLSKRTDAGPNITTDFNDDSGPFDFFSHLLEYTTKSNDKVTNKPVMCKESLAVDDLLELLKNKLTKDPLFKDILAANKSYEQNFSSDNNYTDAGVAAFMGKLYSKREPLTTHKPTESDVMNSTLLADLVEAIIFRNADKYSVSPSIEYMTGEPPGINPVRIQAELAEMKINNEFTGHYFFPEDEDVVETNTDTTTELDYDVNTNTFVSDVVLELEELQRKSATRSFLDDIIDTEQTAIETSTKPSITALSPVFRRGHNKMKKFLEELGEKNDMLSVKDYLQRRKQEQDDITQKSQERIRDKRNIRKSANKRSHRKRVIMSNEVPCNDQNEYLVLLYEDLLRRFSEDFDKMTKKFHCLHSRSNNLKCYFYLICNVLVLVLSLK